MRAIVDAYADGLVFDQVLWLVEQPAHRARVEALAKELGASQAAMAWPTHEAVAAALTPSGGRQSDALEDALPEETAARDEPSRPSPTVPRRRTVRRTTSCSTTTLSSALVDATQCFRWTTDERRQRGQRPGPSGCRALLVAMTIHDPSVERVSLDEPLMTADEVALLLAVPVTSLYEYSRRRHEPVRSIRVGRHRRFHRSAVERWLASQSA
jgi:excisionase family DNA binding protein